MPILVDAPHVFHPGIARGATFRVGPHLTAAPVVARQPVARGGQLAAATQAASTVAGWESPELAMSLWDPTNTTQVAADVTRVRGSLKWLDDPLRVGEGTFEVPTRDDAERTAADQLTDGRVLRLTFRDAPALPVRIVAPDLDVVQARDAGDLRRTIRFADLRHIFTAAKVRPVNGVGKRPTSAQRTVSWASPEMDRSSWPAATERQIVVSYSWRVPNTDPPWFTPWLPPDGWPVANTPVISSSAERTHDERRGLFARRYTVATSGLYQIWCAAWWGCTIYVDGIKVAASRPHPADGWQAPLVSEPFWVDAGPHDFAVEVTKPALPDVSWAPGTLGTINTELCLAFNLHYLAAGDRTVIGESTCVMRSDRDWQTLHNPSVDPSPPTGRWLWRIFTEAQGREALPAALTRGFTDTHDSGGTPWPHTGPHTMRTSDSHDQVLGQLQQLGYRFRMRQTGLTLDAWAPGTAGTVTAVTAATLRTDRRQRPTRPNRLRVTWSDGEFEVSDTAAITAAGRVIEDDLDVTDARTEAEARVLAEAQLAVFGAADRSVSADLNLAPATTAVATYTAWRPLDHVTLDGEQVETSRFTVSEQSTGKASIVADFVTAPESEARRLRERLERGIPGTLGGTSNVATPTRWVGSGVTFGEARRLPIAPFTSTELVAFSVDPVAGRSTGEVFDAPARSTRYKLGSVGVVTSTATISAMRNGAVLDQMFLLPGVHNTEWLSMHHTFDANDELWFRVDDPGEGASLVRVSVVIVPGSPAAPTRPTGRLPWD